MSLPAINIIASDEPLLVMEACDKLILQAKQLGVHERKIVDVVDKYNWAELLADSGSLSLFAETKLTDIRFSKMPNKEAQSALVALLQSADNENLFLIRFPKLEKRQKTTKWFKAIAANATLQELWPPKAYEFVGWIKQRAQAAGVNLSADAAQMLAEQTEGNLLAAKQSLDKLNLLYPQQLIELDLIKAIISDNARYSIFLCLDEALSGKGERAVRMLKKFQQENLPPISILVNLTREIELCHNTSMAGLNGQNPMQALAKTFLWDSKKRLIASAVSRLPPGVWQKLLIRCAFLDRLVKGQEKGNIWQELELCLWMIAGQRIWGRRAN
ncbi:DNA polymerase III subunit delta [Aliikangiella sp. IMCC44359]|uniref:DNA polymerase III subunit delta n=1 Tax=Aliikangiella sp. IMCC44359 TaxID=3459125 RepID=UPI00403AA1DC